MGGRERVGLGGEEGVGRVKVSIVPKGIICAVDDCDSGEDERYETEVEDCHLYVHVTVRAVQYNPSRPLTFDPSNEPQHLARFLPLLCLHRASKF